MNKVIFNFLRDPLRTGVYCSRVVIPHDAILGLWEFLSKKAKEKHRRFRVEKLEEDREYFEFLRHVGTPEFLDKAMDDMLNFLVSLEGICPKEISKWAEYGNSIIAPEYFAPSEEEEGFFFFAPQTYFADIQDAISIRIDNKAFPDFILNVATLTPKALSEFRAFVDKIPFSGSKVDFIDEGKRHSKRFVLDLYPAVAGLWIYEFAQRDVSREIIDLLGASIEYMDKREWQMSIILSAFSVETLLVDIYEEILQQEAPPAPIGFLVKEINDAKKFPPEAMKTLKVVNAMRKTAVHRGMTSFTQKEATRALMGAVQFSLWYCFNGRDFCGIKK